MSRDIRRQGFTLIELMLAMAFVSMLLVAIAMAVIQISGIYNRGFALKGANESGRSMVTELQRSINASAPFNLDTNFKPYPNADNPSGGRLCTGQYSYIWNYGPALNKAGKDSLYRDKSNLNLYKDEADSATNIRFIKVSDPESNYCLKMDQDEFKVIDKAKANASAIELLDSGQYDLALHSFKISAPDSARDLKTGQQMYNISFLLGTNEQDTFTADGTRCKPPNEGTADSTYCAINEFNIVARAGNKVR